MSEANPGAAVVVTETREYDPGRWLALGTDAAGNKLAVVGKGDSEAAAEEDFKQNCGRP